jgi:uncharacterized circularly permuted ATP-grasp superfamily protein
MKTKSFVALLAVAGAGVSVPALSAAQTPDMIRNAEGDDAVLREARRWRCQREQKNTTLPAECRQLMKKQRTKMEAQARREQR